MPKASAPVDLSADKAKLLESLKGLKPKPARRAPGSAAPRPTTAKAKRTRAGSASRTA